MKLMSWIKNRMELWGVDENGKRIHQKVATFTSVIHVSEDGILPFCGVSTKGVVSFEESDDWANKCSCFNCAHRLAIRGKWPLDSIPGKGGTRHPTPATKVVFVNRT